MVWAKVKVAAEAIAESGLRIAETKRESGNEG